MADSGASQRGTSLRGTSVRGNSVRGYSPHRYTSNTVPTDSFDMKEINGHVVSEQCEEVVYDIQLPKGWMYQKFRIFSKRPFWYASPKFQLVMVAFVCFLCPGMFNALSGLGGGGKADHTLADNMNTALYATFAVFGFFGGPIVNRLGVKLTLAVGGLGYCLYAISLLVSVHANVPGFNIFCGALLGFCAGLLWTAQGTIMVSYPGESDKGKFFAWFWGIFNLGAVIGSLIPLAQNINVHTNATVNDGTYIAFIVLMFGGALLALCLCNASAVIRSNGSRVVLMKHPTVQSEIYGMWETLQHNWWVLCLFPMFWSSNWFYTYQLNNINGVYFDTRTKALNSLLYYLAQIIGAAGLGWALDRDHIRRSLRAKLCWFFMFAMTLIIWGAGFAWERKYTRATVEADDFVPLDWTSTGFVGPMFLFIFYGLYDALWQATVYWYMGALSNSGRRAANTVGWYKGIQSAGAAVMWSMDSHRVSFLNEYLSNFALLGGSLLVAIPVIFFKITDHTDIHDDVAGTDLAVEEVLAAADGKRRVSVTNI